MAEPVHQASEDNKHRELPTNEARQGETPHIVRYILFISVGLIAGIYAIWWIVGT